MKRAALLVVFLAILHQIAVGATNKPIAPTAIAVIAITEQPQSQTVFRGQSATFGVKAVMAGSSNFGPLNYQWTFNGQSVGSDSESYTRTNCQENGVVLVMLSATNMATGEKASSAQSSSATLTVSNAPSVAFAAQPENQTVFEGGNATFTVTPFLHDYQGTELPQFHYQWSFDGVPVGSDSDSYTRTNCQLGDSGGSAQVVVTVSNLMADPGYSDLATLTVSNAMNPTVEIVAQPQNQTVYIGQSATFSVTARVVGAVDSMPLKYQWTFKGEPVGADTNTYTRANCGLSDDGGLVKITVSSTAVSNESSPVTLTVVPSGTVYYVSPNGDSSNDGRSTNSSWPLQYAMNNAGSGSTVIVMDGLYTGPFGFNGPDRVTVVAQHKWKAVIANSPSTGIYANSYSASGGIYMSDHITFDGLCVSNNATDGVEINNYCVVRNCWILNNRQNGINASAHTCSNNIIEYNLIEHNDLLGTRYCHGMYVAGPNNIIRGNVVRDDVAGYGIHVYTSGTGALQMNNIRVYNNLTYGNGAFGVTVWGANGDTGALPGTNYVYGNTILDGLQMAYGGLWITNNIILPGPLASSPMVVQGGRTVYGKADYNLGTNAMYFSGNHDVITNYAAIGFLNPIRGLYWLASNSAARAKAFSGVCGSVDFFGNGQISVNDIGAFQYNASLTNDVRVLNRSQGGGDYWAFR